ncbi:glycosyl hydrolase [Microbacterium sp. Marseille-Q6648]|uniref:glycosyl hydrolase n=1 Tax=Microbacterium sp. Marseille-Q6648 TaxID=2937991 RepID=UPI00203CE185|nr:glycosyl hydrolase [Microbacterium sp. Marseille-Q6648]
MTRASDPGATAGRSLIEAMDAAGRSTAPMMRWWWFGPDVVVSELDRELTAMADAGIGGVEVAAVYPLTATSPPFLGEQHRRALRFAAERAGELGLRFDLTLGSGWPYGGPHIDATVAARRLEWVELTVPAAGVRTAIPVEPGDEPVAAFVMDEGGTRQRVPLDGGVVVLDPHGSARRVRVAVSKLTGQQVKRASAGAEGPVLDHCSRDALERHLRAVGEPLVEAAGAASIHSVFCDSLEAFHADWTPALPEEFRTRRGYDLLDELWLLDEAGPRAERVRADRLRTLTELVEENFIAPLAQWADDRGLRLRIQAYGEPPVSVSSYRHAHEFEGESWGWNRVTPGRWASSAASLHRRPVVSAETWTWVHSPSFRATPLDLVAEAHDHLLSGVNQFVGHGWPYSPPDADGLGWFFYAAGCLDDRNPWWRAMPELTRYLARLSWLMRQGRPFRQVALYLPTADAAFARTQDAGGIDLLRRCRAHIGDAIPAAIRAAGADFDLVDDTALKRLDPSAYPIVVLPHVGTVDDDTAAWLRAAIAAGADVVRVGGGVELGRALDPTGLGSELARRAPLGEPPAGVGVAVREMGGVRVHLIVNTTPQRLDWTLGAGRSLEVWHAASGTLLSRAGAEGTTRVVLEPFDAVVATTVSGASGSPAPGSLERRAADAGADAGGPAVPTTTDRKLLDGHWTVAAGTGPARAIRLPHRWEEDAALRNHSGTAVYQRTIVLEHSARAVIDFGDGVDLGGIPWEASGPSFRAAYAPPIGEIAVVVVDGNEAGVAWRPPYRVDLGVLGAGAHTLRIAVSNTAASALAADPHVEGRAREAARSWGERFVFQDLDIATADTSSGMLTVPVLTLHPA